MNSTEKRAKRASERNLSSLKDAPSFLFYFAAKHEKKANFVDGIDRKI